MDRSLLRALAVAFIAISLIGFGVAYLLIHRRVLPFVPKGVEREAVAPKAGVETPLPGTPTASATLALGPITVDDQHDEHSAKRFVLHIPIKARPEVHVDAKEVVIHVLFFDLVDGHTVVQTSANVDSHWVTPPANWTDQDTQELAVEYRLPNPKTADVKRENRKYFGYLVRIYYKQQLQAAAAEPGLLGQQHPPPAALPGTEQ
jgi:hypothetical protein